MAELDTISVEVPPEPAAAAPTVSAEREISRSLSTWSTCFGRVHRGYVVYVSQVVLSLLVMLIAAVKLMQRGLEANEKAIYVGILTSTLAYHLPAPSVGRRHGSTAG
jgi:hypothetical protein